MDRKGSRNSSSVYYDAFMCPYEDRRSEDEISSFELIESKFSKMVQMFFNKS